MCEIEKRQKLEMRSDCYSCLWIIGDLIKYTHFSKTRSFGFNVLYLQLQSQNENTFSCQHLLRLAEFT